MTDLLVRECGEVHVGRGQSSRQQDTALRSRPNPRPLPDVAERAARLGLTPHETPAPTPEAAPSATPVAYWAWLILITLVGPAYLYVGLVVLR